MISTAMVQVKGGALARTGADYVVSSDPSCLLQVGGWLSREGKPILPLHIAEVLAHDA
jgi:L-lactate dehydrogenase complex protein LldE